MEVTGAMTTPSEGEGPMDPQSETVRVPSPDRTSTPADAKAPTQSLTWRSPGLWIVIGIAVLTLALAVFI
jgi:hypothetical protein